MVQVRREKLLFDYMRALLDMILETDLSFSRHVRSKTKPAYYHLKNFARYVLFLVKSLFLVRNWLMSLSAAGWTIVINS